MTAHSYYRKLNVGSLDPTAFDLGEYEQIGPLPAAAVWTMPGALLGYDIDMTAPAFGCFDNARYIETGPFSDLLDAWPQFFSLTPNGRQENDLLGLYPALLGSWTNGVLSGDFVAYAISGTFDPVTRTFAPGWNTPLGFFPQTPDGEILHPDTLDVIGTGTWYHKP